VLVNHECLSRGLFGLGLTEFDGCVSGVEDFTLRDE
jgi:hypothetical protein